MQFNPGDGLGIVDEIDALCDSDSQSYPLSAKARRLNSALEETELEIMMLDGRWQFDDKNYSSQPSGVQTLTSGTQEYDFDSTLLFIERVEVLSPDGVTWLPLSPMDEMAAQGALQMELSATGLPMEYYKRGNKLGLVPIPLTGKVTLTSGLKVYFKRTGSLFAASDTTKVPGIVSPLHSLLFQKAALPYCRTYKKDRVPGLLVDISNGRKLLREYYSSRSKDEPNRMTMKRIRFR